MTFRELFFRPVSHFLDSVNTSERMREPSPSVIHTCSQQTPNDRIYKALIFTIYNYWQLYTLQHCWASCPIQTDQWMAASPDLSAFIFWPRQYWQRLLTLTLLELYHRMSYYSWFFIFISAAYTAHKIKNVLGQAPTSCHVGELSQALRW